MELIFKEECYRIMGACFEVYKDKGCGFHEPVYDDCLEIELGLQGIPFVAKTRLELRYKGSLLRHPYEPDFVNYGHHPSLEWERIASTKNPPPRL